MIRTATESDYGVVVALFREGNTHNHQVAPDRIAKTDDVLTTIEYQELLNDKSSLLAVYEHDGQLVGLILATHQVTQEMRWLQTRNAVHLEELVVTAKCRGGGIASLLIKKLTEWAQEMNDESIDLHVWQGNDAAIKLYVKHGFHVKQKLMTLRIGS